MATSTITLYKTDLTADKNARVDDIELYLGNIAAADKVEFQNMQYIRLELSVNVKFNLEQLYASKVRYNFAKVVNSDNTSHPFYYYILDSRQVAQNTVELMFAMDTVNSLWSDVSTLWSDRTLITRRHKDRFKPKQINHGSDNTLYRVVNPTPEGLNVTKTVRKYKPTSIKQSELFPEVNGMKWYLVYRCDYDYNDSSHPSNPLKCFLYPDSTQKFYFSTGASSTSLTASTVIKKRYYLFEYNLNNTGTIDVINNGVTTTYTLSNTIKRVAIGRSPEVGEKNKIRMYAYNNNNAITANVPADTITLHAPIPLTYYADRNPSDVAQYFASIDNWNGCIAENNNANLLPNVTGEVYIYGIQSVNRTDSKIAKIVELPYQPVLVTYDNVNHRYNIDQSKVFCTTEFELQIANLDVEFAQEISDNNLIQTEMKQILSSTESQINNMLALNHNIKFESKLYNNEFYTKKYVYDTFEKEIFMERFNYNQNDDTDITIRCIFKPSKNISSRFLFKFYTTNGTYDELTDYGEYLNVNRNNEVTLFSNQYVDYMRSGFNYDQKKIKDETTNAWLRTGVGAVSAVASAFAGPIGPIASISAGTSAVQSIVNNIYNTQQSYRDLDQKINQFKQGTSSVKGADDLDLLNYYNGNSLQMCAYEPYEAVKTEVYNLLRLTGYADHTYAVPSFNTRIWYDFLQCTPVFNKGFEYDNTLLDDFKSRLQTGITIYHNPLGNGTYNFEQTKENFEVWFLV